MIDVGIEPQFFVNDTLSTIGPPNYGFSMTDSIYQAFPELELVMSDPSGLSIELGTFTRGLPLKIIMGAGEKLLEAKFVVDNREVPKPLTSNVMNGIIKVRGIHESYMQNREKISAGYKKKKVSDILAEILPGIEAEDTVAKLAIFQFAEPYTYAQEILLDIADSPTNTAFVFFRDLAGKLQFKSIGLLADQSPVGKLTLMQDDGQETLDDMMNTFLPFDERLTKTFHAYSAQGAFLDRLNYREKDAKITDSIPKFLPVIADTIKSNYVWMGREFNPDMDYGAANQGILANGMREGFLTDKAFTIIPFNSKYVCGKAVDVEVFLQDENRSPVISEVYSDKWLIESSIHTWDGAANTALTKLVLSRSSLKPVSDSVLESRSYKG